MAGLGIHSREEPIPALAFQGGRHAGSTSHSDRGGRLEWHYVRRSRRCPLRGESCGIYKGHSEGSYGEVDVPEQRAAGQPSVPIQKFLPGFCVRLKGAPAEPFN